MIIFLPSSNSPAKVFSFISQKSGEKGFILECLFSGVIFRRELSNHWVSLCLLWVNANGRLIPVLSYSTYVILKELVENKIIAFLFYMYIYIYILHIYM